MGTHSEHLQEVLEEVGMISPETPAPMEVCHHVAEGATALCGFRGQSEG